MAKISTDKDIKKAVKEALKRGWTLESGKKHGRMRSPCGLHTILINGSPSDCHALENFKNDIAKI